MTRTNSRNAAAVVAIAVLTAACSAGSGAPPSGPSPAEVEAFETLYRARQDSARMRFTGADVRFMTHMIHHHAQAIEMAGMVPQRTADEQIRILAARITNAQRDEIAIMRRWLEDRDQPVPQVAAVGARPPEAGHAQHPSADVHTHAAGGGNEHAPAMDMPGMLTDAELRRLATTRGGEFDRLFLSSMIRHHRGAVAMVKELFATDGAGQDEAVFKFASDVQVDQATEIARMESMLAAMRPADAGR